MTPLRVEFLPRRVIPVWMAWGGAAVMLTAAGIVTAWDHHWRQRHHEHERMIAAHQPPEVRLVKAADPVRRGTPTYFEDARTVAQQAELDLSSVFSQIEAAGSSSAKLVSLEIDMRDYRVQLELQALNYEDVLAYLSALNGYATSEGKAWQLTSVTASSANGMVQALVSMKI